MMEPTRSVLSYFFSLSIISLYLSLSFSLCLSLYSLPPKCGPAPRSASGHDRKHCDVVCAVLGLRLLAIWKSSDASGRKPHGPVYALHSGRCLQPGLW